MDIEHLDGRECRRHRVVDQIEGEKINCPCETPFLRLVIGPLLLGLSASDRADGLHQRDRSWKVQECQAILSTEDVLDLGTIRIDQAERP